MTANNSAKPALGNNTMIIIMILVCLLSIGAAVLVDKSLVTTIVRNQKVLEKKALADNNLKQNLDSAPGLVQDYRNLGPLAATLNDALPETKDFPSILVAIENMAIQSGVSLKTVAPSLPVAGTLEAGQGTAAPASGTMATPPKPTLFTVTFDGSYTALAAFLKNIELSARPMRISDLKMSGSGSNMSGEVSVETYYQDKAVLPFSTERVK